MVNNFDAIKVLSKRITELEEKRKLEEETIEDPQNLIYFEFACNTVCNIDYEIFKLQKAIKVLAKYPE